MKKFLTLLFAALLVGPAFAADAANDVVLSQRKADNSGFIQRNVVPVTNGFLTFDASKVPTSPDLTYSTPTLTVPAGFGITGAGSLTFTAGGSNQSIATTSSGTGFLTNSVPSATVGYSFRSLRNSQQFSIYHGAAGVALVNDSAGALGLAANASVNNDQITLQSAGAISIDARGTNQSVAINSSGTGTVTLNSNFIATSIGNVRLAANLIAGTIASSGGARISTTGNMTVAAWGVNGLLFRAEPATLTDSSSSGTVATAVANSFAVPTLAASSSTTFTNAATVYIAGDVANGTNVTLSNSYGLWNVGKTRLDGALITTPQALSGAGAVNLTTSSTHYTSTGGAQALTLANGTVGQFKTIIHVVDGGSGVLTPTTPLGYATITFTNAGDAVHLEYTAAGWAIVGINGATKG